MATVIFEQVTVVNSFDGNGNKLEVYRYWENEYGQLGRFRGSEKVGYGEKASNNTYNFLASGKIAEKLNKMKLKMGSKLFITGEIYLESFVADKEANQVKQRWVVKISDVRFSAAGGKKDATKEQNNTEKSEVSMKTPKRIPIPNEKENRVNTVIPLPKKEEIKEEVKEQVKTSSNEDDEILNLDIQELFTSSDGFMGI